MILPTSLNNATLSGGKGEITYAGIIVAEFVEIKNDNDVIAIDHDDEILKMDNCK